MQSGISSAELMTRAGRAAAAIIADKFASSLSDGALIFAGPGNNGGDAWVVAESLAQSGNSVRVIEVGTPKSQEAIDARTSALATSGVRIVETRSSERLVIDGLLGTGATGNPRGAISDAIDSINALGKSGADVVSLDIPSGVDASTGEHDRCVIANETITFGVVKRGQLIARGACGEITAVDIGLLDDADFRSLPLLVDSQWVHHRIPPIPPSAHKGTRKHLAIVGGGKGMAGAAILAGEGALRSGIGLLRIVCDPSSVVSVHAGIPAALVSTWPQTAEHLSSVIDPADCIAIGPGLGNSPATRDLVERVLLAWTGPAVLDADALNVFAGDTPSLAQLLAGRAAILTPHPAELGRLLGIATQDVVQNRFEVASEFARTINAVVIVKGSPTVIFGPRGERLVVASGTAALATGGSGDVLTGMTATLLAQLREGENRALEAAACAAWIHGRAAELCHYVRGVTLADVLDALPRAWNEEPPIKQKGILAALEAHK